MSSQISILIYGRDAQLLDTRRWVLEQAGYWVSQTTELSSLVRLVQLERVNLLLLCHTLSMEDCGRALALVQTRWPEVQTITLVAGDSGCRLVNASDSVDSTEGPARLINAVEALVKTSPLNA